jgi:hypothetical protein
MYGTLTASLDGCIVIDIVEQLALGSICASGGGVRDFV